MMMTKKKRKRLCIHPVFNKLCVCACVCVCVVVSDISSGSPKLGSQYFLLWQILLKSILQYF